MKETKTCTKCNINLPKTTEYFRQRKDGYWISRCKKCTSEDNKYNHSRYYSENKEKVNKKNLENYYKRNPKKEIEEIEEGYKKCYVCEEIKPITNEHFGNNSNSKDGFKYSCKKCRRETEYLANREHNIEKQKVWYEKNKVSALKNQKEHMIKTINRKRSRDKEYYQRNKEVIKERSKQYMYNRMENDLGFKILQRCRSRLYKAIKGYIKSARTQELIGCTVEELLIHIEMQFQDRMTWDNYGEWHLDHIIPCASFDFSKTEAQFECFNYKNLQPLWAEDNFKKNRTIF